MSYKISRMFEEKRQRICSYHIISQKENKYVKSKKKGFQGKELNVSNKMCSYY